MSKKTQKEANKLNLQKRLRKQNLVPKSWLICVISSLWQLLKTSIKNYSYKCKLEEAAGKFSNEFILFKANKGMRNQLKYLTNETIKALASISISTKILKMSRHKLAKPPKHLINLSSPQEFSRAISNGGQLRVQQLLFNFSNFKPK